MPLAPFKLLSQSWNSEQVNWLLSKFVNGSRKKNACDSLILHLPQPQSPLVLQSEVVAMSLPGTETLVRGAQCGAGSFFPPGGSPQPRCPSQFLTATGGWDQLILRLCPSCQSQCGLFCASLVAGLLFS